MRKEKESPGSREVQSWDPAMNKKSGPQRRWGSDSKADTPRGTKVLILQGAQRSQVVSHFDYEISLSCFVFKLNSRNPIIKVKTKL